MRKAYVFVLVTALIITMIAPFSSYVHANEEWIEISTPEELDSIRNDLSGKYRLVNDIDLSNYENWEPIGGLDAPFLGSFDGNGFLISNLTINRPDTTRIGLFGESDGGEFKNIRLENVDIRGHHRVGGLVGANDRGVIANSYVTGSIQGTYFVGGLVGLNEVGEITNSFATGSVTGKEENVGGVGGLIGLTSGGAITNSFAISTVIGGDSDASRVGGLIGDNFHGEIVNTYAVGFIAGGEEGSIGGLVGVNHGNDATFSYWNIEEGGLDTSGTGTGITTNEMVKQATYEGWDFEEVWDIVEGKSYPYLKVFGPIPEVYPNKETDEKATEEKTDITTIINSGPFSLSVPEIHAFGNLSLQTKPVTHFTTFADDWNIVDARGTHEGWRVQAVAQPFKEVEPIGGFKDGTEAYSLPEGSLTLIGPESISRVGTGNSELPVNHLNDVMAIDTGSAVTVIRGDRGEATGEFSATFGEDTLGLILDPETTRIDLDNYPGEPTPYETTITWTLVSGP